LLVVDASSMAPFVLADEEQHRSSAIFYALKEGNCVAPALWTWEIANLLWKSLRSGRITQAELTSILREIEEFGVTMDHGSIGAALGRTLELANRHGLTAYDAAYLELALRTGADLASHDAELREAALAEGLAVHPT
jgi:predicted nucleic acid-binding protein